MKYDLIGQTFGRLTVLEPAEDYIDQPSGKPLDRWICKCTCGNTTEPILDTHLRGGHIRHCGCKNTPNSKDMTGFENGYLRVLRRAPDYCINRDKNAMWICWCSGCNRETKPILGTSLRKKTSISCGCRILDVSTIHGGHNERLYGVYRGMIRRCYSESDESYKNYGARGIYVCPEWRNDYAAFRDWAMKNGYNPNAKKFECTIDRIDNNGPYSPDNCRFIDMKGQSNNRRSNHVINIRGEDLTISEVADKYNLPYYIISSRLYKGYAPEDIIAPIREMEDRVELNGNMYTYNELSEIYNIPRDVIYDRIRRSGYTVEQAVTRPYFPNEIIKEYDGVRGNLSEWGRAIWNNTDIISHRIKRDNYSFEEALLRKSNNIPMNAIYFIDEHNRPISETEKERRDFFSNYNKGDK